MRRNRSVKVIATLGPASSSPEMIEKLFLAGADVFRINMSHTAHKQLEELQKAAEPKAENTSISAAGATFVAVQEAQPTQPEAEPKPNPQVPTIHA